MLNNKGTVLIPFEYEQIEADRYQRNMYKESGYIVRANTSNGYKYGYINSKWKKTLNTEYSELNRILDIKSENVYIIGTKNGRYGLIKNKEEKIDFVYKSIMYNSDINLLSVERNDKYGVLNLEGETVVPVEYNQIRFSGIYIYAKGYTGDIYFDAKGNKIENGYTGMKEAVAANCYITTNEDNLYGLADKDGNKIVENSYSYIDYAFGDYFIAYKDGKGLGVIDKNNNVLVDFGYSVLNKIGDVDLLKAVNMGMNKDETTIFSKNLEKLVTAEDMTISIYDDYVEIYSKGKEILIDNSGKVKTAKEIFKDNKLFGISKNNKWGFEDANGEIKVECIYDNITEFNKYGFAGVKKDNKWGVINENGEIVLECVFEFEEDDLKPEFLGKYYKSYKENNEVYYTN